MIKDPWGKLRSVKDNYDNKDMVISTDHVFKELIPTDQLSRSAYNFDTTSTKVNESRDVTILVKGPYLRKIHSGTKIGTRVKNW